jgi:hypothetical protein
MEGSGLSRVKSRRRNIFGEVREKVNPEDSVAEKVEGGISGCECPLIAFHVLTYADGFSDAGMLLPALRESRIDEEPDAGFYKRNVGRRLRLAEY